MHLGTFTYSNEALLGVRRGDRVFIPALANEPWRDMLALIDAGAPAWQALRRWSLQAPDYSGIPLVDLYPCAPIVRPRRNLICLGWNYATHAAESAAARSLQAEIPAHPVVFTKAASSVIGPQAPIPAHTSLTTQLDWEVELAVVIGRGGRNFSSDEALATVFGYTIINDVSARDLQARHKQFFIGKSLPGLCPMGPWIVTADELPDPQRLRLQTWVNGQIKQDGNTQDQIFPLAQTIAFLSRTVGLEAGDVIATGTPSGVGFARNPPEFLRPGDVVECAIEGIGRLRNEVREDL